MRDAVQEILAEVSEAHQEATRMQQLNEQIKRACYERGRIAFGLELLRYLKSRLGHQDYGELVQTYSQMIAKCAHPLTDASA